MFCPECGKPSGPGRCTSCGAVVPLPGESEVKARPLDRALDLDRRDRPAPPVNEAVSLERRGAPREREPAFTQGLKRRLEPPRDPADVLIEQARGFEAAEESVRAFEALAASLLLRPLDARPVRDLERLAAVLGRRADLAARYREVLAARPDHPGAAAIRGRIATLEQLAEVEEGPAEPADVLVEEEVAPLAAAPLAPRTPPPAPILRDPELLDAALARLPVTPGPGPAPAPRPANREGTVIHGRVAPTWRRLVAGLVDVSIVFAVPAAFVVFSVQGLLAGDPLDVLATLVLRHAAVAIAATVLVAITGFVYLTLFGALGGRTVGARLVGLRAVDARSGRPPGPGRAALRAFAAVLGTFAFLAGPLWALFDRRGQALHDKLARTITILLDVPAV